MSIFASMAAPADDEHEDDCAHWDKTDPESWEISGKPCSCGEPNAPLVYRGSHVLPSSSDERGGHVDLALIPAHVRYWRENPNAPIETEPDFPPEPYLRFGVNEGTVILERHHVEQIVSELSWWLNATKEYAAEAGGRATSDVPAVRVPQPEEPAKETT